MSRGQRIARALGRAHTKLAGIYYEGECLKPMVGHDPARVNGKVIIWSTHWFLDRRVYSDITSGKQYRRLVIEDVEGCRKQTMIDMTAVQIGEYRFKFVAKPDFLGSVASYEFRLSPTGERV